jgi:hypothetical protein
MLIVPSSDRRIMTLTKRYRLFNWRQIKSRGSILRGFHGPQRLRPETVQHPKPEGK